MEIHPMPPSFIIVSFIFFLVMVILCAVWKWIHDRDRKRMWQSAEIVEGPATKAQAEAADRPTRAAIVEVVTSPVNTGSTTGIEDAARSWFVTSQQGMENKADRRGY